MTNIEKVAETIKSKRIEVVRGVSSKNGREYVRLDIVFEAINGKEFKKGIFLNYNELFILGLKE